MWMSKLICFFYANEPDSTLLSNSNTDDSQLTQGYFCQTLHGTNNHTVKNEHSKNLNIFLIFIPVLYSMYMHASCIRICWSLWITTMKKYKHCNNTVPLKEYKLNVDISCVAQRVLILFLHHYWVSKLSGNDRRKKKEQVRAMQGVNGAGRCASDVDAKFIEGKWSEAVVLTLQQQMTAPL